MAKATTQTDLDRLEVRLTASFTESLTATISTVVTNHTLKILQYFDKKFEAVDARFVEQDRKFDSLFGLVNGYAKRVEVYRHEILARDHQFGHMGGWLKLIAQKVNIELGY